MSQITISAVGVALSESMVGYIPGSGDDLPESTKMLSKLYGEMVARRIISVDETSLPDALRLVFETSKKLCNGEPNGQN